MDDVLLKANLFSKSKGIDAVIITASSKTNKIVSTSARMCRKRGRIVLVGVVGLELNRSEFYEKELTFQVSCSYGPGRYDKDYEEKGNDYPIGFVRWTEQRNFEAVLDLMSMGSLNLEKLITHKFPISEGYKAIQILGSKEHNLGILLQYSKEKKSKKSKIVINDKNKISKSKCVIGVLGSGSYAKKILLPMLKQNNVELNTIVSRGGVSAVNAGKKFGFINASSDENSVFRNSKLILL